MAKAPRKTTAPAPAEVAAGPIPPPEVEVQAAPVPPPQHPLDKYGVGAPFGDWSEDAQKLFNATYRYVYDNQPVLKHPKASTLTDEQWKTVAWNAAWIAANELSKLQRKD